MFNSKLGIGVLKHPGYNGKGGGSSAPTATDFFGMGKRAPYANLLAQLFGLNTGSTSKTSSSGGGGGHAGKGKGTTTSAPGQSIFDFIQSQPGYQFGMTAAEQGAQRKFAATGSGPSGAEDLALRQTDQQYAGSYYDKMVQNLMTISGATQGGVVTPATQQSSPWASILGTGVGAWAGSSSGSSFITSLLSL